MNTQKHIRQFVKLVREGDLAADVEVRLIESDGGIMEGPCLPPAESKKLDTVRRALRAGDIRKASRVARRVNALRPVEAKE